MQSLMADPSENPIQLPDLGDIFTGIQSFLQGFWEDFEIFTLFLNPNSVIYAIARSALGWEQPPADSGLLSADVPDPDALAGSGDSGIDLSNVASEIGSLLGL
jgi:hypothetical protein